MHGRPKACIYAAFEVKKFIQVLAVAVGKAHFWWTGHQTANLTNLSSPFHKECSSEATVYPRIIIFEVSRYLFYQSSSTPSQSQHSCLSLVSFYCPFSILFKKNLVLFYTISEIKPRFEMQDCFLILYCGKHHPENYAFNVCHSS